MWIIFGLLTLLFTILNIIYTAKHKHKTILSILAISFMTLTLCASYNLISDWVINKEWSSLEDVVPTLNILNWIVSVIFIFVNGWCSLIAYKK